jgi:glycosyltransferase involved in cell wall biosynthesis
MHPSVLQIGARWFPEFRTGLERYYYDLVHHLPSTGIEIRGLVLAASPPNGAPGLDIKAYARPDAFLANRVRALRRATQASLRLQRPSLLACHYPLYGFPISDIMKDIPTVFHFHGPWAAEGQLERNSLAAWVTKRCIEQFLYRRPACFVVLSKAFREVLIRTYGVPADRIAVIPGGVDITRFENDLDRTESRHALGLATGRPLVLTIRRLVRRMGLENLIDGIAEASKKFPDILLVIGGTGPLQSELEQRIGELNLVKNIQLLGNIQDAHLPLLYRAADVSIVPSLALEGFGLTTVESLACGTPVLVTPVGGLPEAVADLAPSLVLRGSEPRMLADGLIDFFSGALAAPDAGACAAYARQHFDWPIIARQVANLYRRILAVGDETVTEEPRAAASLH